MLQCHYLKAKEIKNIEKNILIIGAGGHSKVVYDLLQNKYDYDEIAFLDDNFEDLKIKNNSLNILGKLDLIENIEIRTKFQNAFVAIGESYKRVDISKKILQLGFEMPNLIHPTAYISKSVQIGIGNLVLANVVLQADVNIDNYVIINNSCNIDHDCVIEEGVHISPGVIMGGNVKIG